MKKKLLVLCAFLPLLCLSQTWNNQNSSISNDLNSVSFIDDNNGWAVGRQGKIVHTTNGGSTWSEQNSGTSKDLNKVHMISSTVGYAVGNNGTFIKYNGSAWSTVNINFSQDMHGVFFLDASTGWISGDWGRIMMTTNGGSSWTNQVTNATYSNLFYDLYMLSPTEGWAVGTSGKVLKFDGSNWANISNPASADLYSVYFSSSSNGFMTGKNSAVYQYNGSSWSQHNTALPDNGFHVYDVHIVNNNLAYAATTPGLGGAGIILKYNGSTWTKDYEFTGLGSELFYGITITPGGNAYAVAAGGMIKAGIGTGATGIERHLRGNLDPVIFPNPFADKLILAPGKSERIEFSLTDVTGKVVKSIVLSIASERYDLDCHDLEPGVYLYTVTGTNIVERGKLVKN